MDWLHNLRMTLRYENKEYVLENPIPEIDKESATPKELDDYNQHVDNATMVACIMIATIAPMLQKIYETIWPYDMNLAIYKMFLKKERKECYEVVKAFMTCKLKDWESMCAYVQMM